MVCGPSCRCNDGRLCFEFLLPTLAVYCGNCARTLDGGWRRWARTAHPTRLVVLGLSLFCVTVWITSIQAHHIRRPAIGSGLSKIFIGVPRPSASSYRQQTSRLQSKPFLRKLWPGRSRPYLYQSCAIKPQSVSVSLTPARGRPKPGTNSRCRHRTRDKVRKPSPT